MKEYTLPAHGFRPDETLPAGQTFCWTPDPEKGWNGWVDQTPVWIQLQQDSLHVRTPSVPPDRIRACFRLGPDEYRHLLARLPDDPHLTTALAATRGLRCVREPWWECMANFICSSLKQIPHISALNKALRDRLDAGSDGSFPGPDRIARAGEARLRTLGLGFRARSLHRTAMEICEGRFSWHDLDRLDTPAAAARLQTLPGIGPKIAHCILLHAADRLDAFPVDVWVSRLLHTLYFPKRRKPLRLRDIEAFSRDHFGPLRGVAQLHLFHWFRTHRSRGSRS